MQPEGKPAGVGCSHGSLAEGMNIQDAIVASCFILNGVERFAAALIQVGREHPITFLTSALCHSCIECQGQVAGHWHGLAFSRTIVHCCSLALASMLSRCGCRLTRSGSLLRICNEVECCASANILII